MARVTGALRSFWNGMPTLRRVGRFVVIAAVALVALYIVTRGALFAVYGRRLDRQIAAFKAAGGETDIMRLAPQPYGGAGKDPADYMLAAGYALDEVKYVSARPGQKPTVLFTDAEAPESAKVERALDEFIGSDVGETHLTVTENYAKQNQGKRFSWRDEWLPWLDRYIANNSAALELARRGAAGEGGSFKVAWADGYQAQLPHLSKLRALARTMRVAAIARAHHGDADGAMEDVRLSLRLRRFLNEDPTLISKLVSYAMDSITFTTLQAVLDVGSPSRESIEAALAELEGREEMNRLTRAFTGEAAMGYTFMAGMRRDIDSVKGMDADLRGTGGAFAAKALWLIWLAPADQTLHLKVMTKYIEASKLPYPDLLTAPEPFEDIVGYGYKWHEIPGSIMTRMLCPGLGRAITQEARMDTQARLARTVLALALYKMDNGAYPESLDSLAPKYLPTLQMDPYTGQPLLYARRGEGFVVYSAGEGGVDNGGVWDGYESPNGDYTWERTR